MFHNNSIHKLAACCSPSYSNNIWSYRNIILITSHIWISMVVTIFVQEIPFSISAYNSEDEDRLGITVQQTVQFSVCSWCGGRRRAVCIMVNYYSQTCTIRALIRYFALVIWYQYNQIMNCQKYCKYIFVDAS